MTDSPQQAAAIPYRHSNGHLQFCLITSMRNQRWIFPKGIIDPGDTAVETALKESVEEAGVHGTLSPAPLGRYEYAWHDAVTLTVEVYLLRVDRVDERWEEMDYRSRRWCTADEALALLEGHPGRDLFVLGLTIIAATTDR